MFIRDIYAIHDSTYVRADSFLTSWAIQSYAGASNCVHVTRFDVV